MLFVGLPLDLALKRGLKVKLPETIKKDIKLGVREKGNTSGMEGRIVKQSIGNIGKED